MSIIVSPTEQGGRSADSWVEMPSGIVLPEKTAVAVARPKPTCVDLFSGCGGFSLGVIEAGFEVVCAVEDDPVAAITYLCNLGTWPMRVHYVTKDDELAMEKALTRGRNRKKTDGDGLAPNPGFPVCGQHRPAGRTPVRSFILGDIRKVSGDLVAEVSGVPVGDLDLIVGGPPCQGFSNAGKREIGDPRNPLVFEFARLINELKPKTMCMENVPGILTMTTPEGVPVMDAFCRTLEAGGYASYEALRKMMGVHPKARVALRGAGVKPKTEKDAGQLEIAL